MPTINETIQSPNQSSRDANVPQLIVLHICDGYYEGTKATFLSANNEVSSHFIVGKDGRICQCVDLSRMAWCNGTTPEKASNKYFGHSTVNLVQKLGGNANKYSVSIECEGLWKETKGALSDLQFQAVVWLIGHIQSEIQRIYQHTIPLDRQHIVGHYEINPITRANCPGEKFPWNQLIAAVQGQTEKKQALYGVVRQVIAFSRRDNAEEYAAKLNAQKDGGYYYVIERSS